MIHVRYHCKPTKAHPEYDQTGDTWVNGWIRVRTFAEAKARARRELRGEHLKVIRLDEIGRVSRARYLEDPNTLEFFDEAQKSGEVFVYYPSVKYPVFCVDFEAVSARSNRNFSRSVRATIKYWVLNETVAAHLYPEEAALADVTYTDFWDQRKHREMAIKLGRNKIRDYSWRVAKVVGGQPITYDDYKGNALFQQYYEEAEDGGECTAFWTDAPPVHEQ